MSLDLSRSFNKDNFECENNLTNPISKNIIQVKFFDFNLGLTKFVESYKKVLESYENAATNNFSSFLLNKYLSENAIKNAIQSNSKIHDILESNSMDKRIWLDNVSKIKMEHLVPTLSYSKSITNTLAKKYKYLASHKDIIEQAAVVHDIGKIFIPKDILDKESKLTQDEMRIVKTHSELGYELLRAQNCTETVADIVNNHHRNLDGSGYSGRNTKANLLSQIITVADKFSALLSKRSYKNEMPKARAIEIIYKDVQSGKIDAEVFEALRQTV